MANERLNEAIIRDHFKSDVLFGSIKFEEQKSTNKKISELLKGMSKGGGNGAGYPEFILTFPTDSRYLIVVECKALPSMHESKNKDKPKDYAVDGVLHYAKALSKEFESALRKITMLGYGLIMTCHLKESADADGNIIGYKPDLNNRCLKIVNGLVDIIGVITQTWNEKGESERWIQTRATQTIQAGSRFRYLEPKIRFGYKEFVDALAKAIEAEEANGATVVDKIERVSEEKVSFTDLMAEAKELWIKLVGSGETANEEVANTILKKVEIIMGHKMKLSEFTEDQVDLLALVVAEMREM
jgi:hypothetical protein